ncbi:MAG: serine/threonine-protein phosphatase [Deltaproteobacteria bacterium]|nr:serine/threonine-protein phosphatase [Deltaproteobacteria bacterium]
MISGPKKNFNHQTLVLNNSQTNSFAMSQKGVTRKENQDRFFVKALKKGHLIAVAADGMGGEAAGDIAAQMAVSGFSGTTGTRQGKELIFLKKIFEKSDKTILKESIRNPAFEGMGTTMTAVFIKGHKAFWAHVGDSRLYIFRKGRLKQVTKDQTFARFLLEEGEITKEQLATHYSRHILDQCIGHGECEPETGSVRLKKNDLVMLSTDGLHKILAQKDMELILNSKTSIKRKAENLIRKTIKSHGNDDITVLLIDLLQ